MKVKLNKESEEFLTILKTLMSDEGRKILRDEIDNQILAELKQELKKEKKNISNLKEPS